MEQRGGRKPPSIAILKIAGNFSAMLRTHADGKIKSATIGAIAGGTWAVAGGIGTLRIVGSIADATTAAADTGPDDLLGTSDDIYSAAAIGTLFVGGDTTIRPGRRRRVARAGGTIAQGIVLLPKGTITAITLRPPSAMTAHRLYCRAL